MTFYEKNNYWTYGEYSFKDEENNEASFYLKYREEKDYIKTVEVIGCSATKNHDRICGNNGIARSQINHLNDNPDKIIEKTDEAGTVFTIMGATLGVTLLICLLILLFIFQ